MANGVAEIHSSSTIDQWRYVEGTSNSVEIRTKGNYVHELENGDWFPVWTWLQEKKDAWTKTSPSLFQHTTEDTEQVFIVVSEEQYID